MKMSNLFAVTLIAGLISMSSAHAAQMIPGLPASSYSNPLPAGTSGNYSVPAGNPLTDQEVGDLASQTKLEIDYTYSVPTFSPYMLTVTANGTNNPANNTATATALGFMGNSMISGSTNSAFPIFVTAALNLSNNTGTVTIENLSDGVASFNSTFIGQVLGQGAVGLSNVHYVVTSVPLPPAFVLFASGLIALAGFGAYRKVYSRI